MPRALSGARRFPVTRLIARPATFRRIVLSNSCSARLTTSQRFHATGSINSMMACSNTVAEIVGVHRIEFPTTLSIRSREPIGRGILALVGSRERWQVADLLTDQRDAANVHVFAIVFGEPRRQILLRHEQARRVIIADIERDQIATVVIISHIMDTGRAGEPVHDAEADRVLVEHRVRARREWCPSRSTLRLGRAAGPRSRADRIARRSGHIGRDRPRSTFAPASGSRQRSTPTECRLPRAPLSAADRRAAFLSAPSRGSVRR